MGYHDRTIEQECISRLQAGATAAASDRDNIGIANKVFLQSAESKCDQTLVHCTPWGARGQGERGVIIIVL